MRLIKILLEASAQAILEILRPRLGSKPMSTQCLDSHLLFVSAGRLANHYWQKVALMFTGKVLTMRMMRKRNGSLHTLKRSRVLLKGIHISNRANYSKWLPGFDTVFWYKC